MDNKTVVSDAIANMAATSDSLYRYCNDPKHYNEAGSDLLERMAWDLCKQANDLREIRYMLGL